MLCVYVSPENSPIYSTQTDGIEILTEKILHITSAYPNARLVLTGDLNARVGTLIDYIEHDDIKHIFDYPSDIFHLQRQSKDTLDNTFGKTLIDICKVFDIHILNGRCKVDMHGEFTCTANDGKSVVDYFIAPLIFSRM